MAAEDHKDARLDYEAGMKYKDIADKYSVSINTIKSWQKRFGWVRKKGAPETEKECTQNTKRVHPRNDQEASKKSNKAADRNKNETGSDASELTEKLVLFVAEYLIDFNATRAAMAVGYSKKTAGQIGYQLLQKTSIQKEIQRQTKVVSKNLGITSQRVLLEYLKIAFVDITNYVTFGQKEIPVGISKDDALITKKIDFVRTRNSDEVDGTLIREIKQSDSGITIKFYDKMKALEKLEKYLDLLPDHHQRMIQEEKLKLDRERLEHTKQMDELKNF